MKFTHILSTSLLSLGLGAAVFAAQTPAGTFDIGSLAASAKGDYVEVNLEPSLLSFVARVAEHSCEPEASDVLKGLKRVRVNVVKLDDSNREAVMASFSTVKEKLNAEGWAQAVSVREKGDNLVNIYMKARGEEAIEGLVITVIDGNKEAVFINIVGDIRPEQLGKLGAKLDIDPLKKLNGKNCNFSIKKNAKGGVHVEAEAKIP